jgi:NADH-quinone oxidoreductase subunit G
LLVFTTENRIVEVFGDHEAPVNRGHLCARGRYGTWAEPRPRITRPLVRRDGKLVPATWAEAARVVQDAAKQKSEWRRALLVSPRVTNETVKAITVAAKRYDRVGAFVAKNEVPFCSTPEFAPEAMARIEDADAILLLGAQPSRDNGVVAAKIRRAVRRRGAKLLIFHTRKSDLDAYADVSANVVSLERSLWKRVADTLKDAKRPVLVYGPAAMTPIGITVLDRLIAVFEKKRDGSEPHLIPVPITTNSLALSAAGVEPLEDIGPWLETQPLNFLHILASDEPDGGAHLLDEKRMRGLLGKMDCVVLQASYESPLMDLAAVVLPAAIWCEKSGSVTNFEGRVLPLQAALPPQGEARQDNAILEAALV